MTQIVSANKAVYGLRGEQKREDKLSYRLSTYCIRTECGEGTLLYHTLSNELLLLTGQEEEKELEEQLIQKWFLVPEEFNENQFTDQIRQIAKLMQKNGGEKTEFTILTTTDCNARCYYCYEKGIRREPMTRETAIAAADYIACASRGEKVRLRWFGGEPLFNREAIDVICGALEQKKICFESAMTTNGFYLDEKTTADAVEKWNLKNVQITVDGTEKTYNRIKAYIDAEESPYQRVMNNIRNLVDARIQVNIRLNMDAGNASDLLMLADDLATRFQGCENLKVYVALLHEFAGKINAHKTQEQKEKDYFAIRERLKGYGLLRQKKLPTALNRFRCFADSTYDETILPDGRVGRCEHVSESMITGHISREERDETVTKRWQEPLVVPECNHCSLYPQCRKLSMCEWNRKGCHDLDRRIDIAELKEQMLAAYQEWKKGENEI